MIVRAQAIATQIQIASQATVEATQRLLAQTAKREHGKVMRDDPKPSAFRRWVDGREGANEETVKPFGIIHYEYARTDEVVRFAMETLFKLSPVLSGAYRNAHTLFVSGAAVPDLKDWKMGSGPVHIANPLPYARKIELGRMKMRVPKSSHVYQQAAGIVSRRYGNVAKVAFGFISVSGAALMRGRRSGGSASTQEMRAARVPALTITPLLG